MPVRFNSHHRYLDVNRGFKDDFFLSAPLTEKKEGNRVSHNEREFSRYLDETWILPQFCLRVSSFL